MAKKKTTNHTKLFNLALSKIARNLLPYLVENPAISQSKTGSTEKISISAKLINNVEPPSKPALHYSISLNSIKLNEYESLKLREFLEKAITAKNVNELDKVVNDALYSGIRVNACNERGLSFSNVVMLKMFRNGFIAESIMKKLALSGASFDKSLVQNSKKTIEICNRVEKEAEPIVFSQLKKLKEIGENAATEGTVGNVEFDNKTFYMEFSKNSKVEISKVINNARDLGFSKGDLNLGGNIIKLGSFKLEVKTEKDGKRNYVDISDNSALEMELSTSLGDLKLIIYHNVENYNQIQVKVRDEHKEMLNELQKKGEIVGQGCLFGGIPVSEAIAKGGFIRSGRFYDQKSSEIIKSISSGSWESKLKDEIRDEKTKPVEREVSR